MVGTARVEREEDRDSAAAEARRGGATVGALEVLAVRISDALVLGRLAVPVDDDESELAPPRLERGAMSDDVLAAAPGARPLTAVDLTESSTRIELRRWTLGNWLDPVAVVRIDEVELSRVGSLDVLDNEEMVEPAVVLLLLGIADTDSDSSRRLVPTGFSAGSVTDELRLFSSAVDPLCCRAEEVLNLRLALVEMPGEGSLLEVAELAALGARSG